MINILFVLLYVSLMNFLGDLSFPNVYFSLVICYHECLGVSTISLLIHYYNVTENLINSYNTKER